ncbi:hypothetical protein B0H16DRAFT_1454561 [Mycena metata]|uniref:Uncharacterized protein n=1 Tax=Mycena metata TaxID=1033252 RepID=A0AAD7JKY8_9AGAR|nr:hypothetical protein B0H16DRAFT_1454561 [Mycena metata]
MSFHIAKIASQTIGAALTMWWWVPSGRFSTAFSISSRVFAEKQGSSSRVDLRRPAGIRRFMRVKRSLTRSAWVKDIVGKKSLRFEKSGHGHRDQCAMPELVWKSQLASVWIGWLAPGGRGKNKNEFNYTMGNIMPPSRPLPPCPRTPTGGWVPSAVQRRVITTCFSSTLRVERARTRPNAQQELCKQTDNYKISTK